jgi:cyclic pyranopterin phosphate synthase
MSDDALSHVDPQGRARMVDVGDKEETSRLAIAEGRVLMQGSTLDQIEANTLKKGDVLTTAQLAGVMAAKRTHELIPLCHPLALSHIDLELTLERLAVDDPETPDGFGAAVRVRASVRCEGKTGVEMEALTAVSIAALTVYDMAKAVDRSMRISDVRLRHKSGGRSGSIDLD